MGLGGGGLGLGVRWEMWVGGVVFWGVGVEGGEVEGGWGEEGELVGGGCCCCCCHCRS